MMMVRLLLVAAISCFVTTSMAQGVRGFVDGQKLLEICAPLLDPTTMNTPAGDKCRYYVAGVVDSIWAQPGGPMGSAGFELCIPSNATITTLGSVVAKTLLEQPDFRVFSGEDNVRLSLTAAFRCR